MDPKAAAKSKRSQSQQGRRNHPTPSAVSAHRKKEPPSRPRQQTQHRGEQSGGGGGGHHHHNLPSNWDRYGDDDALIDEEEGGQVPIQRETTQPAAKAAAPLAGVGDALVPKSKGADFGYLIEQARAQQRDRDHGRGGLDSFSLSDEIVPDFAQGLISLIPVKGERLLSWGNDDNFTVDNDAGSSFEVPFLALDVNALAAQLSKLSMAQRLFIEEDILPAELHADRLNETSIWRSDQVKTQRSTEGGLSLAEDMLPRIENEQVAGVQRKSSESMAVGGHDYMQRLGKGISPVFPQADSVKQDPVGSFESLEWESKRQSGQSGSNLVMDTAQKSASTFEVAAAEAELDRLLDSFGVTDDLASSGLVSNAFGRDHAFRDRLASMGAVSSRQESGSLGKVGGSARLEETVGAILAGAGTSHSSDVYEVFSKSSRTQLKTRNHSICVGAPSSGSGFIESRCAVPLEKSIDGLLAETSFFGSSGRDDQRDGAALAEDGAHGGSVRLDASYLREGHDSRHAASTISVDETIDDSLAETTSQLKNVEHSPVPRGNVHTFHDTSTPVSKAIASAFLT